MKEKLQILEKQIRKALPRLMELGEGCRIRLANHIQTSHPENIVKMVNAFTIKNEDIVEIIGHDILLSDVLKWICLKKGDVDCFFNDDGLWLFDEYFWDLSKPYLKDQSEELIEFLYDLIEE